MTTTVSLRKSYDAIGDCYRVRAGGLAVASYRPAA